MHRPPRSDDRPRTRGISQFYFFAFGGVGAVLPYLALVLESRGLTPAQVGRVVFLIPAAGLLAPPLWGVLADLLRARRKLMALGATTCAAALAVMAFDGSPTVTMLCVAVYGVGRAPLGAMADAAAHDALGSRAARFARVRLWGSVGFVTLALLLGRDRVEASWVLGGAAAAYVGAALSTRALPPGRPGLRRATLADVRLALSRPGLPLLLVATTVYTTASGFFDAFMGLHLRSLGHDDTFVGWAWTVGVSAEIALMLVIPRYLDLFGEHRLLRVAVLGAALRWLAFAWATGPVALLAIQLLHAASFALWFLALVRAVQRMAQDEIRTSIQSVLVASMALGLALGASVGGTLFERVGGRGLFTVGAVVVLVAGGLYARARRVVVAASPSASPLPRPRVAPVLGFRDRGRRVTKARRDPPGRRGRRSRR